MNNVGEKYDGNTVPSTLLYGHHLGMENLAVKEGWLLVRIRLGKFESKVGSRRTTEIGNLVVLDIFLVALILIPFNMRLFLSSQNDIFVGKGRAWSQSSKNLYGRLFSKYFSPKISGSQEDNQI